MPDTKINPKPSLERYYTAPGTAIEPTAIEIHQGFAAGKNPNPLPKVFQPLKIRNYTFKNRIWVSPMCMYSSEDGFTNDFHMSHYSQFAIRGAGLVMTEATGVLPEGRITPNCLGIWKDEHIDGLSRIVNHVHKYGAVAGMQLGHSGRKGSTIPLGMIGYRDTMRATEEDGAWPENVYGPSAIAFDGSHYTPREMSLEDIERVQQAFADAAVRAGKAGFDLVELHGAHGYLLFEFLSPLSNQRTDKYGGSFENRTRMLIETVRRVRQVWPEDKPLFVRISASEWVEGGWGIDDTVALAKLLVNEGVDLIDCSSGGNDPRQKITNGPGYQVPFAEKVKREVPGLYVGAVGLITEGQQANEILENDKADVLFIAREFLRNPSFVLSTAHELGVNIRWPVQYERAMLKPKYKFI
ncbi:hypothetical protein GGI15_001382 [Coemansia interrupta]|uniref:NADH:flavin oxidoreductase/NADH oxidase N-terminal domain-containing protein n=1 Tax=Coemansia interrupta TaxID=1126814 RepID=A0A9W8LML8_9FUNG|nr:hypothetical protein GGI15_001382 [Coemansia interrupta]